MSDMGLGLGGIAGVRKMLSRFFGGIGSTHHGARDVWGVLGYPKVLTVYDMWTMYLRGGIASRVVCAAPQSTWREQPLIRDEKGSHGENDGDDDYSPFVASVDQFFRDHSILSVMERADRLSRIGRFGVLLLGFADGKKLYEPLESTNTRLMYIQPYGEPNVQVSELESDVRSPRYGMPRTYNIVPTATNNLGGMQSSTIQTLPSQHVHHSRIIHIAEMLDSDNIYGQPVLQPIFNHLIDLEKVLGSSAETFWLNARGGMSLTVDPDAELTEESRKELRKQADEFEHQLRRILMMQGVTASMLDTRVSDPEPNVEKLIELISGSRGIPKRILIGSERGELASTQDENNWGQRIDERQLIWATPHVIKPFVEKMIETGNIAQPEGDWWVEWPQSTALSPERQAEIGVKRSQTLASYANSPSAQLIVPYQEFRQEFLGLDSTSSFDENTPTGLLSAEELDMLERGLLGTEDVGVTLVEDEGSLPLLASPSSGDDAADQKTDLVEALVSGEGSLPAPFAEETVADTAMNGAQVSGLKSIVESVAQGILPIETGVHLIMVGFPSVSEADARSILNPLRGHQVSGGLEVETNKIARLTFNRLLTYASGRQKHARMRINSHSQYPLFVYRPVLNANELEKHYRSQGITNLIDLDDIHVTIALSKMPVDWSEMPPNYGTDDAEMMIVPAGGMRLNQIFKDACVLCFRDYRIEWRHSDFVNSGVQWSHAKYRPHVTMTDDPGDVNFEKVKPFDGPIVLGRETWEIYDQDWDD